MSSPPLPDDLDELLPPEPEDEIEDEPPEPEPTPWDVDAAGDAPEEQEDLEDGAETDEEMLPGEALEDDRWWAPEDATDALEDEGSSEPLQEERSLLDVEDEGWERWEDEAAGARQRAPCVGYEEQVTLPDHGLALRASCDTGAAMSRLRGALLGREGGRARVLVTGRELELPVEDVGGVLVFRLRLTLAGLELDARLPLSREDDDGPPLVLGRDLLAGRVLVDPGARDLHPGSPQ